MVYVDTSALVPLFIREPRTDELLDWLERESPRLAISRWTLVEFASACSIKLRTGQIDELVAAQAWGGLVDFAEAHCLIATPGRAQFQTAVEMARRAGSNLRAGDALHLAIAEAVADELLTVDNTMLEAARRIPLKTVSL